MYKNVNNYLSSIYEIKTIFNNALLIKEESRKGIYSYSCSQNNIEKCAVYWSLKLTKNIPSAQTVLYCNSNISEEEIISFLYRSLGCECNALFLIIRPENLQIKQKNILIGLLKHFYLNTSQNIKSCVLFIFDEKNNESEIINKIKSLPYCNAINSEIEEYEYKIPNVDIDIYYSESSGLGKSTLIKDEFKKKCMMNMNINELIIKIEIPNSLIDYKKSFQILKFFNTIEITNVDKPVLNISTDLTSDIEMICNYLNRIDSDDDDNIYVKKEDSNNKSKNDGIIVSLDQKKCSNLIYKYLTISNPNYYQVSSFINILIEQLHLIKNSSNQNIQKLKFNNSSYKNLIEEQINACKYQEGKIDIEKAENMANILLLNRKPFSISQIDSSIIMLINEDGKTVSVLSKEINDENKKYLNDLELTEEEYITINNGNMEFLQEQYVEKVKKILNIQNSVDEITTDLKNIVKSYVFTKDNFIKIIFIYLKIKASIPVIMMGETGCGKTSLIQIIANLKNIKLHILNIHAGIQDNDIIHFLKEHNLFDNNDLNANRHANNKGNNENKKYQYNKNNDEIWVFLDEINTCNSLGLISEIMLHNSCKGYKIKRNVKFIAACNPYRIKPKTKEEECIGLYDEEKHSDRKMVYNVNPLPYSLINFVFDFGTLSEKDIKSYINNMIFEVFQSVKLKNIKNIDKIRKITEDSIYSAHQHLKLNYDISSVSLREVRRWGILFEWFIKFLEIPYISKILEFTDNNNNNNNNIDYYKIYVYSLNLSIYLCYYLRLYNRKTREDFKNNMNMIFVTCIDNFDFEQYPVKIQNIIAKEVNLEKGIAKNKSLLENLFALFVCLNTKIPLFIIGKPGCSKSLSAQLIFKSMNGKDSTSEFFKYFPKVYTKSYQGSLESNSKGILKVFKKARDLLDNDNSEEEKVNEIISAVLHSELEYDNYERKIAFIGISNWTLDASKMNRGIYISIPEPDEEDLCKTAISIAESYGIDNNNNPDYADYLKKLAYTYNDYRIELKVNPQKFEKNLNINDKKYNKYKSIIKEFHGTRDFYFLIKTVSKSIIEQNFPNYKYKIKKIINESIEKNFNGLENSISIFKNILNKYIPQSDEDRIKSTIKYIEENIDDHENRFLLIITDSSLSPYLITSLLKKKERKFKFYYGSNFKNDNSKYSKGYYSPKLLNKIQVTINNNNVMILKNLTILYPSLYDLFNQNFRKIGNENYARITFGDSNPQNIFVNNNFRCIILLDKNEIKDQDPPFINRFEKHIMNYDLLLSDVQKAKAKYIINIIDEIHKTNKSDDLIINLSEELINCSEEEIKGLIFQMYENDNNNEENVFNYVFNKIIPTFSHDLLFFLKYSKFSKNYEKEYGTIFDIYLRDEKLHEILKCYIENIRSYRHIIYTFSNILDSTFEVDEINNEYLGENFTEETTKHIYINQYVSENEIEEVLLNSYSNDNYNLYIFHFDINDCQHLNHIDYLISDHDNKLENRAELKNRVIIIIIHLKRSLKYDKSLEDNNINNDYIKKGYLISHLSEWKQFFIDNLNGNSIGINELINSNNEDLFNNEDIINIDTEICKGFISAFKHIKYRFKINFSDIKNYEYEYINKISDFFNNNDNVKQIFKEAILKKIRNMKFSIIEDIYFKYEFEENDIDFITIIKKYVKQNFNNLIIETLIQFEEHNIFSTKLLNINKEEMNNENIDMIYKLFINDFDTTYENYSVLSTMRKDINLYLGLSFPCIITLFEKINNCIYIKKEEYLKSINNKNNKMSNILEYILIDETKRIINNNNYEIIMENENSLSNFLNDYIIYFLGKSNESYKNKNIIKFFEDLYDLFIYYKYSGEEEFNNKYSSISIIMKFILFIESNNNHIYNIVDIVYFMDSYFSDFNIKLSKIISERKFMMDINNGNSFNRNVFYSVLESVIYCILCTNELPEENIELIISKINIFSQILQNINFELELWIKQIFYLHDFIKVEEYLKKNKNSLINNLNIYLDNLKQEVDKIYLPIEYNGTKDVKLIEEIIKNEFKFLNKCLNKNEYIDLIVSLIYNKIKISKDEDYRLILLNIISSNDHFICKSKSIFEIVLNMIDICPKYFIYDNEISFLNEMDNIKMDENWKIIKFFNETNNVCMEDTLISLFEDNFSINYNMIQNPENIYKEDLQNFIKCVYFIKNYENDNFQKTQDNKLCVLYCIAYIRYFCFYYVKYIYEKNKDVSEDKMITFINGLDKKFRKDNKLYYNDFNFIDTGDTNRQNEKTDLFIEDERNENNSIDVYIKLKKMYNNIKLENFNYIDSFITLLKNNSNKENNYILNFINLLLNEEIVNFTTTSVESWNQLSSFVKTLLLNLGNINSVSKELLGFFFVQDINIDIDELTLFSYKIAFLCSLNEYSIYSKFISKNVSKVINIISVPGINQNENQNISNQILSLIFYSCIFWDNELGYSLNDSDKDQYYKNKNKLRILWNQINKKLKDRNVTYTQNFLYGIIKKIVITSNKFNEHYNERNGFEIICQNIINDELQKVNIINEKYQYSKERILKEEKSYTIKDIIQNKVTFNDLFLRDYPLIKYFYLSQYFNVNQFKSKLESFDSNKYPVINTYLRYYTNPEHKEKIEFLKNFKLINPFILYVTNKYKDRITRLEAKKIKIESELNKDKYMKILFEDFKKGWEELENIDDELGIQKIDEQFYLAYILNDDIEENYGKNIAKVYDLFITYQNEFLNSMISSNLKCPYLFAISNQFNKKIVIQNAKPEEIVSLKIKNSYNNFEDLIASFSYKNNVNGTYYRENIFDFESIENELSKILLPRKKLFKEDQYYIKYIMEDFNQNDSVICDFKNKINNSDEMLTDVEKNIITENNDYKLLLFNIQTLFIYFNSKNISGEELLKDEIISLPENVILDKKFLNSFKNSNIKLNKLVHLYEYIELLNFNNVKKIISLKQEKLNVNQMVSLKKYFEKSNLLITKDCLKDTVRKFISRYLVNDNFNYLKLNICRILELKTELWNVDFSNKEMKRTFKHNINSLKKINILIEQSIDFYDTLSKGITMSKKSKKKCEKNCY
ncbi:hypothetical protein PIROE2DRAFT_6839 [Piromyces sp. E2]|nr:hypothetical protein PIROE2DRAFT_6839 [Piromyces sp. E2]|eukprot:OUM66041.1 hypothetical protein PIROE2DRAFT_6839 [Piromyces sp. E2]